VGGLLLGMIGVGTALVAVPLLTFALPAVGVDPGIAPRVALGTSMAVVSITSVSSVISHHRLGNVDWGVFRTTVLASLAGVAAGSLVVSHLPTGVLRGVFAAFLLYTAWKMWLPAKAGVPAPCQPDETPAAAFRLGGAAIGVAGSMIGAGGGVFMVPFLSHRGLPMKRAVATSTTIGLPVTIVGVLGYALFGLKDGITGTGQLGYVHLPAFLVISVASIATAPLGARLSSKVPAALLKRAFALVLPMMAVKMMLG